MLMLRSRGADWVVPPMLVAACVLTVIAFAVVGKIGENEQHHRAIPTVSSATVTVDRPGQSPAHGVLTRSQATDLALLINQLRRAPSYGGCAQVSKSGEVITFAAQSGPITVHVTCSGVDISSRGQDWGADKYDRNGVIAPALRRDLPALPWGLVH